MADVEQRAEAEAAQKGLSGGAAKAYVGGVFNRIRQAHSRGTQPGKGARHLQRRARVEARQEAKNRIARHEQLGALEKLRMRMRTRQEEPRKPAQSAPTPAQPAATGQAPKRDANKPRRDVELTPINVARDDLDLFDPAGAPDPARLRRLYGDAQLYDALNRYDTWMLKQSAREQGVRTGGSRQDIIKRLMAKAQGQPAPTPAQPAATGQAEKPKRLTKAQENALWDAARNVKPIKELPSMRLDATRKLDPYFIREYYGQQGLEPLMAIQTPTNLREAVEVVEKRTGKTYRGSRSADAMRKWILANMNAQPAPTPAQPAATGKAPKGGENVERELAKLREQEAQLTARYNAAMDAYTASIEGEHGGFVSQLYGGANDRHALKRERDRLRARIAKLEAQ